jgi:hypothetical protein
MSNRVFSGILLSLLLIPIGPMWLPTWFNRNSPFFARAIDDTIENEAITFKSYPQISAWEWVAQTYGGFVNPSDAEIISDVQTMKALGFTTVIGCDMNLTLGTYDDDPSLYRMSYLVNVCQQNGMYAMLEMDPETGNPRDGYERQYMLGLLGARLEKLSNYYKNYPYVIGICFDDAFRAEEYGIDLVSFDNFVRQHFILDSDYFTYYVTSGTTLSTSLNGKNLCAILPDWYWEADLQADQPDWTTLVSQVYGPSNANYTVCPVFDCYENQIYHVYPSMWEPQVSNAIASGCLAYDWYCWRRTNTTTIHFSDGTEIYVPIDCGGLYTHPEWWATVKNLNQQILTNITNDNSVPSVVHDIALTNLTSSRAIVGQGYPLPVNLIVTNVGNYLETFNITGYADQTIGVQLQNVTLSSGNTTTITSLWNTTGFGFGNYTLSVCAWPVAGEINTANNNCTYGQIRITIPGDVDGDFAVKLADLVILANAYGSKPGDAKWNPNADIEGNNAVGLSDLVILAQHYGQHYP